MTITSRREFLTTCIGAGLAAASVSQTPARAAAAGAKNAGGIRYCLNTSTIMGQKLGIVKEIEIAARAGYNAIEPWVRSLEEYVKQGGSLAELRKRIEDSGLTVEGGIGFAQWIVDDPAQRAKALEQVKHDMELLAQIGAKRMAAPASGAQQPTAPKIDLRVIAERYLAVLELGDKAGVVPELELWGHSTNLKHLSEGAMIIIETGHPKACILPDVYHMYKGGTNFNGLAMLSAQAVQVLHMNDYPANPPRETITDRNRVYPGDGVAPLKQILGIVTKNNPNIVLSLELFNPDYWKQDPLVVAKTGLEKMKAAVKASEEAK